MSKLKKLLTGLEKKYIFSSMMSPVVMIGEVVMEVIIPFIMAMIIDDGIGGNGGAGDLGFVVRYGLLMIGCACVSLLCGVLGTFCSTYGAQGFGCTLRKRIFTKIQDFSFANIDKFSTASLITRLTTDVNMAQNVYRMLIHMCVRSPF
ncbi:MAG: ABC transporter ATP-binding protein, partial [Treponema sp.]|nr:ABC transporter ATP-binding protein [Treponema sp.]